MLERTYHFDDYAINDPAFAAKLETARTGRQPDVPRHGRRPARPEARGRGARGRLESQQAGARAGGRADRRRIAPVPGAPRRRELGRFRLQGQGLAQERGVRRGLPRHERLAPARAQGPDERRVLAVRAALHAARLRRRRGGHGRADSDVRADGRGDRQLPGDIGADAERVIPPGATPVHGYRRHRPRLPAPVARIELAGLGRIPLRAPLAGAGGTGRAGLAGGRLDALRLRGRGAHHPAARLRPLRR